MRTYDHYAILSDDEHDEYVPAEVAQALYDALVDCRYELLVRLQNEFGPKIAANCLSIIKSNAALSIADGVSSNAEG